MRWGIRMLGLASVVVLARVLRPEDFGIQAMAALLVGLLDSFVELGVAMMLIRERDITTTDLNTAWTIRILQGVFLGAVLALLAGPAAVYFHEPRVTAVVYLCALAFVIGSFGNIGVVLIRKELDFARDFRYQVILKLADVLVTIGLALWLRSYWALALAQPISALNSVAVSYLVHSFRPSLCLTGYRRFLRFSVNVVLSNVARFLGNKVDVFMVGSIGNSSQMGIYNVAAELSSMPARELTVSVGRALFPSLAKAKHDRDDFVKLFLQVLESVAMLCLPIGFGLWVVASDVVHIVLGDQWVASINLMRYLAIYGTLVSLIDIMIGHVLIVTGHEGRQAAALWIRCSLVAAGAVVGAHWGIDGVAIGVTISGVAMFAVTVGILAVTLPCRLRDFFAIAWRPTLAASAMAALVSYTAAAVPLSPAPRLIVCIVIGIVSYIAVLALLWRIAGKPQGAEAAAIKFLSTAIRRTA